MSGAQTAEAAIESLRNNPTKYQTPETLRELAKQVDVSSSGRITVLYSGNVADRVSAWNVVKAMETVGEDVRLIDKTEVNKFLNSEEFISATADAHGIRADDILSRNPAAKVANEWLYHPTEGPWADASARFADATQGEVKTIVSGATPKRVFGATELPRILANPNVTNVDGIPREVLAARQASHGPQAAFDMIVARSHENVGTIRTAVNAQGSPLRSDTGHLQLDNRGYFVDTNIEGKAPTFSESSRSLGDAMGAPNKYAESGQIHIRDIELSAGNILREQQAADALRVRRGVGAGGAVVLGAAVEAYQWNETLGNANTFRNTLGNDTAANEALARQTASSTSGIVGGVVGTGAAATLGLGTGGTFALVAADAYFFSAAADKAVTLWQQDKIYQQTSDGVKWEFKGNDWVREDLRADFVRDGVDNPKQQPIAASFDKARELSYLASVEAVEQQLGKVPAPRNPFEQPAAAGDAYSARPSPWTYSTESAQWSRQLVTQEGDDIVGAKYGVEIATGERPAQLSAQALRTIDANLASGPAAIAAQYEVGYIQRGYQHQGKLPASIEVALDPNLLQASDGKHYRRDEQGQWTHEGEKASAQRALELTITHDRLAPALQLHEQAMTQIPPWQRPTQQQLDLQTLQDIYVRHHVKPPEGEQLDAAYAAVLRTRNEQGLPAERLSLTLEADANGQFSQRSTIQHLQKDADGVLRVAAITTASEIDAIQQQPSPTMKSGQPGSKSDSEKTPTIESPKPLKNEHTESTPHFGPPIASRSDDKEVVGLTTGLQVANDFRDKNHPGNPRYQQMLHEVERMETTNGIAHGPNTSLMAAALAIKAEQSKFDMSSIVKLEQGGQVSAMKLDPYAPSTKVSVDPKAVIAEGQSFEKSTEQWSQARSQHYASNAPAAERTLEQVKALSQLSPADQAIFEKIRQNVPPHINDEVVARATLQAKQVGVSNVDQIDIVAMAGNSISVKGRTPGMRSTTDATEPTAPMPETAKQTETFNQQIAIDQRLAQEQAYAKQQEQSGLGLGVQMSGGMAGAPRGPAQG